MPIARILCRALGRLWPYAGLWFAVWAALFAISAPAVAQGPAPMAGAAASQVAQQAMPRLFRMRLNDAQTLLERRGLQRATPTQVASQEPVGTVVDQNPLPEAPVTRFTPITVNVSRGPDEQPQPQPPPSPPQPQQLMPNLVGMSVSEARFELRRRELQQPEVSSGPGPCPGGVVSAQRPRAGRPLTSQMSIRITVADGTTEVPTIMGRTPSSAEARLARAGLRLGAGSQAQVSGPSGLIVRSVPAAGQPIACGGAVAYVVAGAPPPKTMPNVVGGMLADASAALAGVGLQVNQTFETPSTQPPGEVVTQQPPAGQTIQPSTFVRLGLSDGSTRVPSLVGKTPAEADPILAAAGLAVGARTQQPSSGPSGRILSSTPAAGALVRRGSPVGYAVATPQPRAVPNVVGASRGVAEARLDDAGFRAVVASAPPGAVLEDRVAQQRPPAGAIAAAGSRVRLTLAEKAAAPPPPSPPPSPPPPPQPPQQPPPPPLVVPDVVGESEANAVRILDGAGYRTEVTPTALGYWPTGRVLTQYPGPQSPAPRGSTVTLVLAVTMVPTLAGGAAVLVGLVAAGWFGTWPARIAIRPGVTALSPPEADDRDLGGVGGLLMSWSMDDAGRAYEAEADGATFGFPLELTWSVEVGEHQGLSKGDET